MEAPINSYVFFDLETTGLPGMEYGRPTKITELSMLGVLRKHLEDSAMCLPNGLPRVTFKLLQCYNPRQHIQRESTSKTGLDNAQLDDLPPFDNNSFATIHSFLTRLPEPVCLIAHNGDRFDFPIFTEHLRRIQKELPESFLCADTYRAFISLNVGDMIFENGRLVQEVETDAEEIFTTPPLSPYTSDELVSAVELLECIDREPACKKQCSEPSTPQKTLAGTDLLALYGATPTHQISRTPVTPPAPVKKKLFDSPRSNAKRPRFSYALGNVHKHITGTEIVKAHTAEGDTEALLACVVGIGKPFHEWVMKNHKKLISFCKK